MMNLEYLLKASEPWVVYRTLRDLLDRPESDTSVIKARADMISHPLVVQLLTELQLWPGKVLNSHKSAGQLYHKLGFALDLGICLSDDHIRSVADKMTKNRSEEGLLQLPTRISAAHGGSGQDLWAWALCDAPLLMSALLRLGLKDEYDLQTGYDFLVGLCRANGWPCAVSPALAPFRGPGKKEDPCPYATLIMLKLMTAANDDPNSPEAQAGITSLLDLWEHSRERHPYIFYMGTDFRKLKAPFIWYDILHVADVLSQYPFAIHDDRFADMLATICSKRDAAGCYTPESVWMAWSGWDFAQKKQPSSWLTFLVYRICKRAGYDI